MSKIAEILGHRQTAVKRAMWSYYNDIAPSEYGDRHIDELVMLGMAALEKILSEYEYTDEGQL